MEKKKIEQQDKKEPVEWISQIAVDLKLPHLYVSLLDKILKVVASHCYSVVLNGSWVNGTSSDRSDIDLLLIAHDENRKTVLISIVKEMFSKLRKPVLDFKILCLEDIKRMSLGGQHFAIWQLVTKGVVLQGFAPKSMVKLNFERIRTLIFDLMNRINECIAWLESNSGFTGASIHVAYVVRTLYFIEKDLLKSGHHSESKTEFIQRLLGSSYERLERIRREIIVAQKDVGEMGAVPRVHSNRDQSYSQEQYQELIQVCLKLERIIQEILRQLNSIHTLA
ncbi:MAG: hypothetical protein ACTSWA_07935 [Candidatus Thorarchaeota archaeon]